MHTVHLQINDSDLASRQAAASLRADVEACVRAGTKAVIDFSKVFSVSESYADELFGVLALRHGLEWLSESVTLENTNPLVFRVIAAVIRQRLVSGYPQTPNIALLAAQKALKQRQSKSA